MIQLKLKKEFKEKLKKRLKKSSKRISHEEVKRLAKKSKLAEKP